MNIRSIFLLALGVLLGVQLTVGQETNTASSELKALVTKINDKLHEGKRTEADLAPNLAEFDALLDKYKDQKNDDTAQIILMKAMLYLEVLEQNQKGIALIQDLKTNYPETKAGKSANAILENIRRQEQGKEIQRSLVAGAKFPDFQETDLEGKAVSPSNFKGKVLLIDFWATWCRPCVLELPNVIKAYEKYHEKGFEIIGVSLDRTQDEEKLKSFLKEKNMTWQQYFDGKEWRNKLAEKYGIESIPATFLLDGEGKIIGRDLRGEALDQALAKALPK